MRNLQITNTPVALPKLGILTNVTELSYYDMIYIHHLLKDGSFLELRKQTNPIFDEHTIEVYFKQRKIGYISNKVNQIVSRQIDRGMNVYAVVRRIKRNKSNPLAELEVQVLID